MTVERSDLFDLVRTGIAESLERGQTLGTVRADISPEATATLIVSTIEGLAGTAKSTRNRSLVLTAAAVLMQFLESLRPVAAGPTRHCQVEVGAGSVERCLRCRLLVV